MSIVTVEIDDDIRARLDTQSRRLKIRAQDLVREALLEKLEELEDAELVRARLARPHRRIEDAAVWKELDLED